MQLNKSILATSVLLFVSIVFFGTSMVDEWVQDYFFNFNTKEWILQRDLQPYKFIFYDGIKRLLIAVAVAFLTVLVFFRNNILVREYKKGIAIVILSSVLVPLSVGIIKKTTNMPCPKNEIHYGGSMPKSAVWQSYNEKYSSMPRISCYPAGHASGGFALLSLFFLFKTKSNRVKALIFALVVGWSMGFYKMLIGDHFLSHTVISMILAWLIILLIKKVLDKFM